MDVASTGNTKPGSIGLRRFWRARVFQAFWSQDGQLAPMDEWQSKDVESFNHFRWRMVRHDVVLHEQDGKSRVSHRAVGLIESAEKPAILLHSILWDDALGSRMNTRMHTPPLASLVTSFA